MQAMCLLLLLLAFISAAAIAATERVDLRASAIKPPHIILILADDYGHANVGYNRDPNDPARVEVHTPNLDALATQEGVILQHHYAYKFCSPSRSSLQSGRLPVHVNTVNVGVTFTNPQDPVSGYQGIPRNMTGIAAKLRGAGYRTHAVGKWDAGMATPEHTPLGRGYDSWLGYYQHANDYYTKGMGTGKNAIKATGELDNCLNEFTDLSEQNSTFCGGVRSPSLLSNLTYEADVFKDRALATIAQHDPTHPLFLFYAFHLLHTPLQIPEKYLEEIDSVVKAKGGPPFDLSNRRKYAAMTLYMDEAVGMVVQGLKDKDMWKDTMFVFITDNGGPVYEPGAANNHPLRGGKFADFEGGVRTNAFVSGGRVPASAVGSVFKGVVSIADWYTTFCAAAGVSWRDESASSANPWLKQHGLPTLAPVDGRDQWGAIVNGTVTKPSTLNVRPDVLHLSADAVLRWPYKLITGRQPYATWTGPRFPNCSSTSGTWPNATTQGPMFTDFKVFGIRVPVGRPDQQDSLLWIHDCDAPPGCLFNVAEDPTEHHNLAGDPSHAALLADLRSALHTANTSLFSPDRGAPTLSACDVAIDNGRYYGAFIDVPEGWYTPPAPLTPDQREKNEKLKRELKDISKGLPRQVIIDAVKAYASGPLVDSLLDGLDSCRGNDSHV